MRRRSISLLSALLLAGCGGNGSHHSSTTPTPPDTGERVGPRISIAWPARTRNFPAPGYANAARIVFPNSGEANGDAAQVVTRPAGDGAVTQDVLLDYAVRPGNHLVRVEFLIDPGVSFPLATASVNLKVNADGTLSNLDGSALGTVSYGSRFTSLNVATEGTLEVGTTTRLFAWATVSGGVIALPPGSAQFTLDSGGSFATLGADETITGIAPGNIVVTAKVDEVTSPTTLTVSPSPIAARTLSLGTNDLIADPTRNSLFAALGSTGQDAKTVARIDPATGAIESRITLGGSPSVLALSDDGSTLYAGLKDVSAVSKIDAATGNVLLQFAVPDMPYNSPAYALDMDVLPGHPETLALTRKDAQSSGTKGPAIFDNGVKRPNEANLYEGDRLNWISPTKLVTYSYSGLEEFTVDALGIAFSQPLSSNADLSQRLVFAGGRLYARNGIVMDAATFAQIGTFALPQPESSGNSFGPAVDLANRRAYFIYLAEANTARLYTFDLDTRSLVSMRRISGLSVDSSFTAYGETRVVPAGPGRLAFRLPGQVVFLDGISN